MRQIVQKSVNIRLESELVEYFGLDIDDEVVVVLVVLELRANVLNVVLVFGSF